MADNYLERRMEDYRSGRLAQKSKRTHSGGGKAQDTLTLRYPHMRVLVMDEQEPDERLVALIKELRSVGLQVAFTADNPTSGQRLSQDTGSRHYPSTIPPETIINDLTERWGGVDVVLTLGGSFKSDTTPTYQIVFPDGVAPRNVARGILFLLHPDNAFMLNKFEHLLRSDAKNG
ncbi:MAG: hypothetical protein NC039_08165 [Muribaculaceae bacterium]|nr:hypothetical protein [Muribaculaceae bacterium]